MPVFGDVSLFEMLTLEGAQAGLSWETVLKKREGYRRAFGDFEPGAVAAFTEADIERLMMDPGIVRNQAEDQVFTIVNAQKILEIQSQGSTFTEVVWAYVGGKQIDNAWRVMEGLAGHRPRSHLP